MKILSLFGENIHGKKKKLSLTFSALPGHNLQSIDRKYLQQYPNKILEDIVSLALFEKTHDDQNIGVPQLDFDPTISQDNRIAEIKFIGCDGNQYRAIWQGHFDSNGQLIWSDHKIYALPENRQLNKNRSDAKNIIDEKVRLSYSQFRLTMFDDGLDITDVANLQFKGFKNHLEMVALNDSLLEDVQYRKKHFQHHAKVMARKIDNEESINSNEKKHLNEKLKTAVNAVNQYSEQLVVKLSEFLKVQEKNDLKKRLAEVNEQLDDLEPELRELKKRKIKLEKVELSEQSLALYEDLCNLTKKKEKEEEKITKLKNARRKEMERAKFIMEERDYAKQSLDNLERTYVERKQSLNQAKKLERELSIAQKQVKDVHDKMLQLTGQKINDNDDMTRYQRLITELDEKLQLLSSEVAGQHIINYYINEQYKVENALNQLIFLEHQKNHFEVLLANQLKHSEEQAVKIDEQKMLVTKEEKRAFLQDDLREHVEEQLFNLTEQKLHSEYLLVNSQLNDIKLLIKNLKDVKRYEQDIENFDSLIAEYKVQKEQYEKEITKIENKKRDLSLITSEVEATYNKLLLSLNMIEQRQRLKDGEPCPLCGSLEHPAHHKKDEVNSIVVAKEERLTQLKAELDSMNRRIEHADEYLATIAQQMQYNTQQKLQIETLLTEAMEQNKFILLRLKSIIKGHIDEADFEEQLLFLQQSMVVKKQKLDEVNAQHSKLNSEKADIKNALQDNLHNLEKLKSELAEHEKIFQSQRTSIDKMKQQLTIIWQERAEYLAYLQPLLDLLSDNYTYIGDELFVRIKQCLSDWRKTNQQITELSNEKRSYQEKYDELAKEIKFELEEKDNLERQEQALREKIKSWQDRISQLIGSSSSERFEQEYHNTKKRLLQLFEENDVKYQQEKERISDTEKAIEATKKELHEDIESIDKIENKYLNFLKLRNISKAEFLDLKDIERNWVENEKFALDEIEALHTDLRFRKKTLRQQLDNSKILMKLEQSDINEYRSGILYQLNSFEHLTSQLDYDKNSEKKTIQSVVDSLSIEALNTVDKDMEEIVFLQFLITRINRQLMLIAPDYYLSWKNKALMLMPSGDAMTSNGQQLEEISLLQKFILNLALKLALSALYLNGSYSQTFFLGNIIENFVGDDFEQAKNVIEILKDSNKQLTLYANSPELLADICALVTFDDNQ